MLKTVEYGESGSDGFLFGVEVFLQWFEVLSVHLHKPCLMEDELVQGVDTAV